MARCHTVVAETIIIIKKLKGYPPINLDDIEERNFGSFILYDIGELKLIEETEHSETFKAECSVSREITTSDEEYKVFKLIDWDYGAIDHERGIDIDFDTKEKFEVVQDDSYWVEDEEEIDC